MILDFFQEPQSMKCANAFLYDIFSAGWGSVAFRAVYFDRISSLTLRFVSLLLAVHFYRPTKLFHQVNA